MPIKELFGGEFFRSSTASHYASNINDVAVDSETREFYGITLSTGDLSDFEYSDLIGLLLLLSVLIFRNRISLIGQIKTRLNRRGSRAHKWSNPDSIAASY